MLVFISIHLLLALLLMYHLHETVQLSLKSQNSIQQSNQLLINTESALRHAELTLEHNPIINCGYKQQAIDYFTSKTAFWWQNNTVCRIDHPSYHIAYVVELIMIDPHARLESHESIDRDNNNGVRIFRITLRVVSDNNDHAIFLKSYVALPTVNKHYAEPNNRLYTKGRLSWVK